MSEPSSAAATASRPAGSNLATAADRLREAARWLVITFGAVVAVVFAGIGISRFGDIDPATAPLRFWLAVAGAALALVGALWALLTSMSLAAASTVSVAELLGKGTSRWRRLVPDRSLTTARRTLENDPLLTPWAGDLVAFFTAVGSVRSDFEAQLREWRGRRDIKATTVWVNRASTRQEYFVGIQGSVLTQASYLRLQYRFSRARWTLAIALLIATAGAAAFVWATGSAAAQSVPRRVTTGDWSVPAGDRARVGEQVGGAACGYELSAVPVTILGEQGNGQEQEIVTAPSAGCRPVRLVVKTDQLIRTGS
ncbi:MAG: hypothetical protein WCB04_09485 [Mycobacteriales bacterium]